MTRDLRMLMKLFAAVFAAVLTFGSAQAQDTPSATRPLNIRGYEHDGQTRFVGVYQPSTYRRGQPAPLIVALHGRFSSPQALHAMSGLAAVAEQRGAVVIYPEALNGFWNDGGHTILNRPGEPVDDAGFIAAAIQAATEDFTIDRSRIFVAGYDSGGGMAYALACHPPAPLAGVTVVSALMWDYARDQCSAAPPTPILIVHGRRDDQYTPINGGDVNGVDVRRLGVSDTLAVWRRINGCNAPTATGGEDSVVYGSCTTGAQVAYVGVPGGGHNWFRANSRYQINRQNVDATALTNQFFFDRSAFALPNAQTSGRSRSWIVYAPSTYDPAQPTSVVVLLHGRPGNAGGMALLTGMNAVAENHNFIVVYPDGIDNEWNAQFDVSARDISLGGRRSTLPQDDVSFLQTMMDDLAVDFNIDRSRLYLGGFSNGGFMSYRMACSAGRTFAAFAPVSGNLYLELSQLCSRSPPTPILIIHGTADPSVPYEGVLVPGRDVGDPIRISYGIQDTVAAFARRNGCSLTGESTTYAERGESPGTNVVRFVPRDCTSGADVVLYVVNGGGHTWPGHPRPQAELGDVNMDMDAGEVLWDFFSRHTLQTYRRPRG
ncbi:MAG: PHB depolymerase family esterase [Terricaulis sp.]